LGHDRSSNNQSNTMNHDGNTLDYMIKSGRFDERRSLGYGIGGVGMLLGAFLYVAFSDIPEVPPAPDRAALSEEFAAYCQTLGPVSDTTAAWLLSGAATRMHALKDDPDACAQIGVDMIAARHEQIVRDVRIFEAAGRWGAPGFFAFGLLLFGIGGRGHYKLWRLQQEKGAQNTAAPTAEPATQVQGGQDEKQDTPQSLQPPKTPAVP